MRDSRANLVAGLAKEFQAKLHGGTMTMADLDKAAHEFAERVRRVGLAEGFDKPFEIPQPGD